MIAGPKRSNSAAKELRVLSPIHSARMPPLFGREFAISARDFAALAEFSTTEGSRPVTLSA